MSISVDRLAIVSSKKPLPTIEVNASTIEGTDFYEVLEKCLSDFARENPSEPISIYDHAEACTFDFGMPAGASFLMVAGSKELFEKIWAALARIRGLQVLRAGSIIPDFAALSYHLQDGVAWKRVDQLNFESLADPESEAAEEDVCTEAVDGKPEEEDTGKDGLSFCSDGQMSAANVARCLEQALKLPKYSICLRNPDLTPINGNATLSTLRERWKRGYVSQPKQQFAWQQGGLDGLCGLYSCINAVNSCITNLDEDDCKELFKIGIHHLAKRKMLPRAMIKGIKNKYILEICNKFRPQINNWGLELKTRWLTKDLTKIDAIIRRLREWVACPSRSAIVGISGIFDHWTCLSETFNRRIRFTDSDGGINVSISEMTCGQTVRKDYRIDPREILGIEII